jgi:hypothetical protein
MIQNEENRLENINIYQNLSNFYNNQELNEFELRGQSNANKAERLLRMVSEIYVNDSMDRSNQ